MTGSAHPGHDVVLGADAWAQLVPPLVATGLLLSGYLFAASRSPRPWNRWRTAAWVAGCVTLTVAVLPLPLDEGDPRPHMVRHLLLGMFAPLGLVLAAPVTLLLRVTPPSRRRILARVLRSRVLHVAGHPVGAALLGTGGLFLVLLTPLYRIAGEHPVLHHGLHLHYLAAGCLFVWAVAGPDPAPRRPGVGVRAAALVGAAAGHAFLARYLYAHPPENSPGDVDAWRGAARLMYHGGDVAELLLAVALFTGWYRRRARRLERLSGPIVSECGTVFSWPAPRRSIPTRH